MKIVKSFDSDFKDLWGRLRSVYSIANKSRMVSVLDNHAYDKKMICKKLGVVCNMDINRISSILDK